jgi:hypothetical protein
VAGPAGRLPLITAYAAGTDFVSSEGETPMTRPWWQWLLGWLGFAAFLATLPFYLASGLLAPGWAIAVLMIVWLALLAVGIELLRRRFPLRVLPVPVAAWLIWFGAISAGERWLGWTG